ncbi:MAG: hypothetical protein ABSF83_03320 [Nitrososphaerales archaeon]|jgi:hypothetical protein
MTTQLDEFLGSRSSLTQTQIQRLMVQVSSQNPGKIGDESEESAAEISGVTQGAYYRVLSQAENNINQALYTLLLCSRLGVLKMDDLKRLLELVGKVPAEIPDSEAAQVTTLVEALVRKIVML